MAQKDIFKKKTFKRYQLFRISPIDIKRKSKIDLSNKRVIPTSSPSDLVENQCIYWIFALQKEIRNIILGLSLARISLTTTSTNRNGPKLHTKENKLLAV